MLTPPESAEELVGVGVGGLHLAEVERGRRRPAPGRSPAARCEDLLHTWTGAVNVPDRHSTVVVVMQFSLAAIQELTVAEVAPLAEANVTVQDDGGAIGDAGRRGRVRDQPVPVGGRASRWVPAGTRSR